MRTGVIEKLDKLKEEFGVRGRSEVIERLVEFYEKKERQKEKRAGEVKSQER